MLYHNWIWFGMSRIQVWIYHHFLKARCSKVHDFFPVQVAEVAGIETYTCFNTRLLNAVTSRNAKDSALVWKLGCVGREYETVLSQKPRCLSTCWYFMDLCFPRLTCWMNESTKSISVSAECLVGLNCLYSARWLCVVTRVSQISTFVKKLTGSETVFFRIASSLVPFFKELLFFTPCALRTQVWKFQWGQK